MKQNLQIQESFNPYTVKNHSDIEHDMMLSNIKILIKQPTGRAFIKYLLKHFGVGELPPLNIDESFRQDMIGFLRAGESIFNICAQADSIETGLILAEIKKEKYDANKTT